VLNEEDVECRGVKVPTLILQASSFPGVCDVRMFGMLKLELTSGKGVLLWINRGKSIQIFGSKVASLICIAGSDAKRNDLAYITGYEYC
jgi:hypothetical protein